MVETGGYYRVEYRWRTIFGREMWSPVLMSFVGPPAVFPTAEEAIEFAKRSEGIAGPMVKVIWPGGVSI